MNHALKRYKNKLPNNIYGISPMRSDGNPAVKIEGGGGQQRYLYTVKIEDFRQMLMSSLTKCVTAEPHRPRTTCSEKGGSKIGLMGK